MTNRVELVPDETTNKSRSLGLCFGWRVGACCCLLLVDDDVVLLLRHQPLIPTNFNQEPIKKQDDTREHTQPTVHRTVNRLVFSEVFAQFASRSTKTTYQRSDTPQYNKHTSAFQLTLLLFFLLSLQLSSHTKCHHHHHHQSMNEKLSHSSTITSTVSSNSTTPN